MAWITLIAEDVREGDTSTRHTQYGEFHHALSRRIEWLTRKPGAPLVFDGADNRGARRCWIFKLDDEKVGNFATFVTDLVAELPAANVRVLVTREE